MVHHVQGAEEGSAPCTFAPPYHWAAAGWVLVAAAGSPGGGTWPAGSSPGHN